jgi:prepilin-type N-terminal cleavage/methylation domain-containing protein
MKNIHSVKQAGYTLVEMMTVVGIMGLSAAAAAPSFIKRVPQHRMNKANWQIFMDLNQAKARAVSENTNVEVAFNNGTESYSIWVDSDKDGVRDTGETENKTVSDIPDCDLYAYPTTAVYKPSGTMECSWYYLYTRVSVPNAGYKYVYSFPNGSIDGYLMQDGS